MCDCVDYDRDWYLVVIWFVFGFVFAACLFCWYKYFCPSCTRSNPRASSPESQEDTENQSSDFQTTYEVVDRVADSEDGFEAIGRFVQTIRSESISSRSSQMIDIHNHGESSTTEDYQPPGIELEHIYSSCGALCDNGSSSSQSEIERTGDFSQYGESSEMVGYQYPRKQSVDMSSDSMVKKEMRPALPLRSETTSGDSHLKGKASGTGGYQYPKTKPECKSNLEPSIPPTIQDQPAGRSSRVNICQSQELKVEDFTQNTEKSGPSGPHKPPRNLQPSAEYKIPQRKSPISKYQTPSSHPACLREYETPPLVPTPSVLPSPPSDLVTEGASGEANYKHPKMDEEFLEHGVAIGSTSISPSTGSNSPTSKSEVKSPALCIEDTNREANYQVPEIDKEFLEHGVTARSTSVSLATRLNSPMLKSELKSPALCTEDTNREANYQVPEIAKEFLEHGVAAGSTSLSPSTEPNPPTQKSPATRSDSNREDNYQYPEIDMEFFESDEKSECKSSEDAVPSSILPNANPKVVPPIPPKAKPLSSATPALYAELNESDRADDEASYEPLRTTK